MIGEFFPQADLVGLWHLNGNSTDSSGNGNNGTDTSITYSLANGKFGQGAGFNGSSSYISTASNALATGNFTISFWFSGVSGGDTWRWLFSTYISGGAGLLITTQLNTVRISMGAWFTDIVSGTSFPDSDTGWNHIVVTRSGTTVTCYINGLKNGNSGTSSANISGPNYIGRVGNNGNIFSYFSGKIDDVAIFNRALSASEIKKWWSWSKGRYL